MWSFCYIYLVYTRSTQKLVGIITGIVCVKFIVVDECLEVVAIESCDMTVLG